MPILTEGGGALPGSSYQALFDFFTSKGVSEDMVQGLFYGGTNMEQVAGALGYKGGAQSGLNLYDLGGNAAADINKALAKMFGGGSKFDYGALRESLSGQLKSGGWALPFDVSGVIKSVAGRKGDFSMLLNRILGDARFKKSFPGIFNKDGTLKMTPSEYRDREKQYQEIAAQFGFQINKNQVGFLVDGNVSGNEWQYRAKATQVIAANADVLVTFKQQVTEINAARRAAGKPPLPTFTSMKDVGNFVTKAGSMDLYATYEAAALQSAAKESGLPISSVRARQIATQIGGVFGLDEAEKGFKEIADSLRTAGVELSAFGLTQKDLETIEFGGVNRNQLAASASQALKQQQAQSQAEVQGETLTLQQGKPKAEFQVSAGA